MIQVAFIFVTAYLIMSSAFLAFGLLRRFYVAIVATVLLGISIYTVPVARSGNWDGISRSSAAFKFFRLSSDHRFEGQSRSGIF